MHFLFTDTATTQIYTLSLHDALPISRSRRRRHGDATRGGRGVRVLRWTRSAVSFSRGSGNADSRTQLAIKRAGRSLDRKSTRLNSSHSSISYAVFCLKKKKTQETTRE